MRYRNKFFLLGNCVSWLCMLKISWIYSITSQLYKDSLIFCFFKNSNFCCTETGMVKKWFADRSHIQLIKWPGNSSDLNPIENAWSWIKMKLKESSATNIEEWKQKITKLWYLKMLDSDYLRLLVNSMPKRMKEVLEKEGSMTHY